MKDACDKRTSVRVWLFLNPKSCDQSNDVEILAISCNLLLKPTTGRKQENRSYSSETILGVMILEPYRRKKTFSLAKGRQAFHLNISELTNPGHPVRLAHHKGHVLRETANIQRKRPG